MSYTLTQFGNVALPKFERVQDFDTAPVFGDALLTIGGGFDQYGDTRAMGRFPYQQTFQCVLFNESKTTLQTDLEALRGEAKNRQKLYRLGDDGSQHWAWARLRQIRQRRIPGQAYRHDLLLEFDIWSYWQIGSGGDFSTNGVAPGWEINDPYNLNTGLYFNDSVQTETMASSPHVMTITNNGNEQVTEMLITLTVGSANITALTITSDTGASLEYNATLNIGDVLKIDTGAFSALVNGSNAYGFDKFYVASSGHTLEGWMLLNESGDTNITVTFTGGSNDSTIAVQHGEWYS